MGVVDNYNSAKEKYLANKSYDNLIQYSKACKMIAFEAKRSDNYDLALEYYKEAYDALSLDKKGAMSPEMAEVTFFLAILCAGNEKRSKIEGELFSKSYDIFKKNLNDSSLDFKNLFVSLCIHYSSYYDRNNDLDEAIRLGLEALETNAIIENESDDYDTIITKGHVCDHLADLYDNFDKDKMLEYRKKAIENWMLDHDNNKEIKVLIAFASLELAQYFDNEKNEDKDKFDVFEGEAAYYISLAREYWELYLIDNDTIEYDKDRMNAEIYLLLADYTEDEMEALICYKKVYYACKNRINDENDPRFIHDFLFSSYMIAKLGLDNYEIANAYYYACEALHQIADIDFPKSINNLVLGVLVMVSKSALEIGMYSTAIDYCNEAMKLKDELYNTSLYEYMQIYDVYGDALHLLNENDDAFEYHKLSYNLAKKLYEDDEYNYLYDFAKVNFNMYLYNNDDTYLVKAVGYANEAGELRNIEKLFTREMMNIEDIGDFLEMYEFRKENGQI